MHRGLLELPSATSSENRLQCGYAAGDDGSSRSPTRPRSGVEFVKIKGGAFYDRPRESSSAPDEVLITHPDHAHPDATSSNMPYTLAARPRRETRILLAVATRHGWPGRCRADRQSPTATCLTLSSCSRGSHRVWPRGVRRLEHIRWTAALVAEHAVGVYDRFSNPTPRVAVFCRDGNPRADSMLQPLERTTVRPSCFPTTTTFGAGRLISRGSLHGRYPGAAFGPTCLQLTVDHGVFSPDPFARRRFRSRSAREPFAISHLDPMKDFARRLSAANQ